MSIGMRQQLEAFAYWRRQLVCAHGGQELWGLAASTEAKLMNQAPLYALTNARLDFYVEAPLLGQPQVDLSAQYFAEAFAEGNPLQRLDVEQEGDFFHFYAQELAQLKPELLRHCNLYLEADITDEGEPKVASFINLSGDFVEELLSSVLAYRGRLKQLQPVHALLEKVKEWCEPWHFGFMESRDIRPLRLVLILKRGLQDLAKVLECIDAPPIPKEGRELLEKIDALGIFKFMLDVDVLADGGLGETIGVELIPQEAIFPATQQQLVATPAFARLRELLEETRIADQRMEGLVNAIIAAPISADTYIYSRISHFKLRWQAGEALPAKVYLQMRPVKRQSCINEALGYAKVFLNGEGSHHE